MRLRITRQLYESIDGIQFSWFRPGYVYQVGTTIGSYLLAVCAAELAEEDEPYIVLAPENQLFHPGAPTSWPPPKSRSLCHPEQPASAADWVTKPTRRRLRLRLKARDFGLEARVAALATQLEKIRRQLRSAR